MKKFFFFAASLMMSASMFAAVDFQYLPTTGGKNAAGTEFNTSDKVSVEAGEILAKGEHFTVKNAYKTTYKVVGMLTDTSYAALQIGDVTVDYNTSRIQGQDNPTAGGANPVIEMKVPNAGACFLLEVDQDGYIYVAVKTTPNKQQFVFESVVENAGVVGGSFVGYDYLSQANPANAPATQSTRFVGDTAEYNSLQAPPAMPYTYHTTSAYSTNGVGVLAFKVYAEGSPYIFGAAGSKMMACGVGFSAEAVEVKAIGSKNIDHTTPAGSKVTEDSYPDVVLSDTTAETFKTVNLTERPIFVKVALPENEFGDGNFVADDTTNIWAKVIVNKAATETTPATYKLNANIYAWTWGKDKNGEDVAGKWIQAAKSGNYYVLQMDGYSKFSVVLNSGGAWGANNQQTVDIKDITADICVRVGDVPADPTVKCDAIMLDCLTGDPIAEGINNVFENARIEKRIENGQLIMVVDGVRYNVQGARL